MCTPPPVTVAPPATRVAAAAGAPPAAGDGEAAAAATGAPPAAGDDAAAAAGAPPAAGDGEAAAAATGAPPAVGDDAAAAAGAVVAAGDDTAAAAAGAAMATGDDGAAAAAGAVVAAGDDTAAAAAGAAMAAGDDGAVAAAGAAAGTADFEPFTMLLAMARLSDTVVDGVPQTAGCAATQARAIERAITEWDLQAACKEMWAVVDSAKTNLGQHNGVAAQLQRSLGIDIHIMRCYAHILHNSLHAGIVKGWGDDPTKKREGFNSPVVFLLEQSASFINRHDSYRPEDTPVCPDACAMRWGIYCTLALWFCMHTTYFHGVVAAVAARGGSISNADGAMMEGWKNAEQVLQVAVLADWGHYFLEHELKWAESGGGFHALKLHARKHRAVGYFAEALGNPAAVFTRTVETARRVGSEWEAALRVVVRPFLDNFVVYYGRETAFLHKAPLRLAELACPERGQLAAAQFLARAATAPSNEWRQFGAFGVEKLGDSIARLAAHGYVDPPLHEWLQLTFGALPILNHHSENILKVAKHVDMRMKPHLTQAQVKLRRDRPQFRILLTPPALTWARVKVRQRRLAAKAVKAAAAAVATAAYAAAGGVAAPAMAPPATASGDAVPSRVSRQEQARRNQVAKLQAQPNQLGLLPQGVTAERRQAKRRRQTAATAAAAPAAGAAAAVLDAQAPLSETVRLLRVFERYSFVPEKPGKPLLADLRRFADEHELCSEGKRSEVVMEVLNWGEQQEAEGGESEDEEEYSEYDDDEEAEEEAEDEEEAAAAGKQGVTAVAARLPLQPGQPNTRQTRALQAHPHLDSSVSGVTL
eukprot:XP_001700685.1 predicted protein [Chlamydomonas reinhardtii]